MARGKDECGRNGQEALQDRTQSSPDHASVNQARSPRRLGPMISQTLADAMGPLPAKQELPARKRSVRAGDSLRRRDGLRRGG